MAYEYILGIIVGAILLGLGLRIDSRSIPVGGYLKLGMILIGAAMIIWGAFVAWTVIFPG